jgi:hypothetical protein
MIHWKFKLMHLAVTGTILVAAFGGCFFGSWRDGCAW